MRTPLARCRWMRDRSTDSEENLPMTTLLREVIELASRSRSGLADAIGLRRPGGSGEAGREDVRVPGGLQSIYAVAEGTRRDIPDQSLMDIVPGYRLVHQDELEEMRRSFHAAWPDLEAQVPFLADYGGCYYLLGTADGTVGHLDREGGFTRVASSLEAFWNTVRQCYAGGIYFLDADGYLDYDGEKEGALGARLNPGCEWWTG
jgi:hypothetical protein